METKSFMEKCQASAHWFLTETAYGKFWRKHRAGMVVTLIVELLILFGVIMLYRAAVHHHQ